jgi:hypothetical protein
MERSKKSEERTEGKKGKVKGKMLKIARVNPGNIRPSFANDFIVSHSENEFFLTFAVLEPPGVLEEKELEGMQQIESIAVAKIAVTPRFAEAIMNALSKNIDIYKEGIKKNEKQSH